MKALIKKLTETFSPSGYENAIREVIMEEIKELADDIRIDALGNLIARKGSGGKKIMLAAHMDEIGLMVNHVDEEGFIRFTPIGGVFPQTLVGSRVKFMNGLTGVIGAHILFRPSKLIPLDKMFIDVGATSAKDCPVKIGDVAAFDRPFEEVGKNRFIAKSMDNRISVATLIETMKKLKSTPHEIYFVFTTQEEVAVRGALTSAYGINPEIGIAIDVCPTGDTPDKLKKEVSLNKGPAIKIKDPGLIADPRLVKWMIKGAEKAKIPYQREVAVLGSTDARAMQVARAGVMAGNISIPCRYIHSPSEMVDYRDVQNTVKLLVELLEKKIEL
ncbi:MAG: M42 family metallopeptidase [Anaerolineae bacterium]|jgi:tetrahedral aminopeptidase|nr:M42 family metallopeptidase [Anaerolineae bacterium]MBT7074644.1 M42 family metallopeptidase [Anaerolineae bacterium]MBT7781686.1 M42 family metallopeptidase [Anaerolineae bacterium]